MTDRNPSTVTADEACPHCGATDDVQRITGTSPRVQAWSCAACPMNWATTVIDPALTVYRPAFHTGAAHGRVPGHLGTEVTQRAAEEHHPMIDTACLPLTELVNLDSLASVATTVWWCRLCPDEATAANRPKAYADAVAHLVNKHRATAQRDDG